MVSQGLQCQPQPPPPPPKLDLVLGNFDRRSYVFHACWRRARTPGHSRAIVLTFLTQARLRSCDAVAVKGVGHANMWWSLTIRCYESWERSAGCIC